MDETYLKNEREFDGEFVEKNKIPMYMWGENIPEAIKSHNRLSIIKVMKSLVDELEGEKKPENVCVYCLDTHYMKVNGKLKRGCVWCDSGRKKNELEPDQLTDVYVNYNQALQLAIDKINNFITKIQ